MRGRVRVRVIVRGRVGDRGRGRIIVRVSRDRGRERASER